MTAIETWTPWGNLPVAANDNKPAPRVVAFTGLAGSGKSTAARYLESKGYTRIRFAGPLKDMMRAVGLSEEQIEGSRKEEPASILYGKTPRHAMQTLGTEWGRNCIHENFWVGLWHDRADRVLESGGRVVVDDCRFPNEAAMVRRLGGRIYRIVGRGGIGYNHASERGNLICDAEIDNVGDLASLHSGIERALAA